MKNKAKQASRATSKAQVQTIPSTGTGTGSIRFSELGWSGDGVPPSRLSLPLAGPMVHGVLSVRSDAGSMIGGNAGAGALVKVGKAGRLARAGKARACGVGKDDDTQAADDFAAWCASSSGRAEIGEQVKRDADGWQALQSLAKQAARRAAGRLQDLRGVTPSATSRDDAQADVVNACAARFPSGCVNLRNHIKGTGRLRILARIAGGAAWQSLSRWSVAGMTGKTGSKGKGKGAHGARVFWSDVFDVVKDCVSADAKPQPFEGVEGDARRAFARWVYRVGVVQFRADLVTTNAGARATAIDSARRRCRVLASVILGQSLFDSCAVHGFATVANFIDSCQRAGLFPALRAARARVAGDGSQVEQHLIASRRYAHESATTKGKLTTARRAARGAALSVVGAGGTFRATTARALRVADSLIAPRVLRRELTHAVKLAKWHKQAARRAGADDLTAFDSVCDGLTSEDCDLSSLRAVFGIADKLGRVRNVSKLDASGIRRGKGTVSRRATIAQTVPLLVKTRYAVKPRGFAVAPLAPDVVKPWQGLPEYLPAAGVTVKAGGAL